MQRSGEHPARVQSNMQKAYRGSESFDILSEEKSTKVH